MSQIYFDTDCLSCFLKTDSFKLLFQLFHKSIHIPQIVLDEICKIPESVLIKKYIDENEIQIDEIEYGSEEFGLYLELTESPQKKHKAIGKGEAAALALAKCNNGIIASNNLRDIKDYALEMGVNYITFSMILRKACEDRLINLSKCVGIWEALRKKHFYLPCDTFGEYCKLNEKIDIAL